MEWFGRQLDTFFGKKPAEMTGTVKVGTSVFPVEEFLLMSHRKIALIYLKEAQKLNITPAETVTFDNKGNVTLTDQEGTITLESKK